MYGVKFVAETGVQVLGPPIGSTWLVCAVASKAKALTGKAVSKIEKAITARTIRSS